MESPTYSTVWTVELDGLPDRASYCVGQYWSPLDSPTIPQYGLWNWTDCRIELATGYAIVESTGESCQ